MRENSFISNFKIIGKIAVFLCIMALLSRLIGQEYSKAAEKNTINAFTKARMEDFYALEKNSLDMVFIGSSHSYCTFDPENFDGRFAISSFQMGTPLQHPDTSYYELLEVLNHQNPSVAVVEVYWDMLDDSFEMKQADSFFEVLENEGLREKYIKEVFPLGEKVKYHFLPVRFQQDYFAYKSSEYQKLLEEKYQVTKKAAESGSGIEEYRSKGYVYCDIVLPQSEYDETNQFKGLDGKNWSFDKTQKKYLEKIIALCRDRNIKLIFVTAPVANVSMGYIKNYDRIHNEISDFAAENQVAYIDYNDINRAEGLLQNENFRDDAHLNDSGVKIVNRHFGDYLAEEGIFTENSGELSGGN